MLYFIVYDTDDDSIRDELRETLRDLGGTHVQYSAFIIELPFSQLQELISLIHKIIMGSQTDVRIIPLCEKDLDKMEVLVNKPYSTKSQNSEVF